MENDKDTKLIYNLLAEENLDAFLSAIRNQLHVYKVDDITHVTRKDLSRIGILSGPDIRRFEKIVSRVSKSGGILGKFNKVLGKKQKGKDLEVPPAIRLWDDFAPVIIKGEDLNLKEILGEGNFGRVHKAEWTRRVAGHDCTIPVAVKCLKEDSNKAFMKEVSILSQLDQNHDNIIRLYGLSIQEDFLSMVTEFAEGGSLLDGLRNGEFVLISLLCQFAVQIASGMMYLEQKGLVHRDLAARNILITAHNQVKVSDFGLSKLVGKDKEWVMTQEEALPIRWLPLESLIQGKFTSASDVWSFGVVLWELFTFGEHPWKEFKSKEVVEKAKNGERLREPDYCPSKFYSLVMMRCWAENPDERLNFEEAKSCLVSVHPTSSYATGIQHYLDDLKYSDGDCITAIKPFEGSSDVWIGQNETTNEFGKFIKSQTSPMQCKIPYASTSTLSPGIETREPPGVFQNGGQEKSQPIAVPSPTGHVNGQKSSTGSMPDDVFLAKPEQKRLSRMSDGGESPRSRYPSHGELPSSLKEEDELDRCRPTSLPVPDGLTAGTFQRYPSCYMAMDIEEAKTPVEEPKDMTLEPEVRSPAEHQNQIDQPVRPKVLPRTDFNRRSRGNSRNEAAACSSTGGCDLNERPERDEAAPEIPDRLPRQRPVPERPLNGGNDHYSPAPDEIFQNRTSSDVSGYLVPEVASRDPPISESSLQDRHDQEKLVSDGLVQSRPVTKRPDYDEDVPDRPIIDRPPQDRHINDGFVQDGLVVEGLKRNRPVPERPVQDSSGRDAHYDSVLDKPVPAGLIQDGLVLDGQLRERLVRKQSSGSPVDGPVQDNPTQHKPVPDGPLANQPAQEQPVQNKPIPAKRTFEKKQAPTKPPRLLKKIDFSDHENLYDVPTNIPAPEIEEPGGFSSEFVIDPSAWMGEATTPQSPDYDGTRFASSAMSRQISRSEQDLFSACGNFENDLHSPSRFNDKDRKRNSAEKLKLRKTQSLESINILPVQQEIIVPLSPDRVRSRTFQPDLGTVPQNISFEEEPEDNNLLDSSNDSVSYKKLPEEGGRKKSLFGFKKKKKEKRGSLKINVTTEKEKYHLFALSQQFPDLPQPEIFGALEISRWNAEDAIKFLKVKKLFNLGLCPQASCLQMLKTYNWNYTEACYAIKIHYIMAIRHELTLNEAAKLLRENQWDVNQVLNIAKRRSFFDNCKLIGFCEAEAGRTLKFLGNDTEQAFRALKIRRVAEVTQKPDEYCQQTLDHCQWVVERAIHYIIQGS